MGSIRTPNTRLDHLLSLRAQERLKAVTPQVDATLAALRAAGAQVEVFGSYARGEFRVNSDVDFLVLDMGPMTQTQVFGIVYDHLSLARFDLVFADHTQPQTIALMREDSLPRRREGRDRAPSQHPVFLIACAKMKAISASLSRCDQATAKILAHPEPAPRAMVARGIAYNVSSLSRQLESILKTLASAIDGWSPARGDEAPKDLLLQAVQATEHRPPMIGAATMQGLSKLIDFRVVSQDGVYDYDSPACQDDVFASLELVRRVVPAGLAEIERFIGDGLGSAWTASVNL